MDSGMKCMHDEMKQTGQEVNEILQSVDEINPLIVKLCEVIQRLENKVDALQETILQKLKV